MRKFLFFLLAFSNWNLLLIFFIITYNSTLPNHDLLRFAVFLIPLLSSKFLELYNHYCILNFTCVYECGGEYSIWDWTQVSLHRKKVLQQPPSPGLNRIFHIWLKSCSSSLHVSIFWGIVILLWLWLTLLWWNLILIISYIYLSLLSRKSKVHFTVI